MRRIAICSYSSMAVRRESSVCYGTGIIVRERERRREEREE